MEKIMEVQMCFKCDEKKPLSEFYKHPMMANGHLGKCKNCTRKDVAENYRTHREYYARYEQERFQRPERHQYVLAQQRHRKYRCPEKWLANQQVSNAIRDGRLIRKPCVICGNPKSQAHHPDYSKPLDVVWLCRKHHLATHGKQAYEFSLSGTA